MVFQIVWGVMVNNDRENRCYADQKVNANLLNDYLLKYLYSALAENECHTACFSALTTFATEL